MNRSYSKIRHIQESNQRLEKRFLVEEVNVPLLSVLANPALISMGAQNGTSIIYLTQRDSKGNVIPNSKYSYQVKGKYKFIPFDVSLYNVKRERNGDLVAMAYPKNKIVQAALDSLIKKEFKSPEGWLKVRVPNAKINDAVIKLKENKGSEAVIDAGNGVKIVLTLIP
jgi:hypothetical protein